MVELEKNNIKYLFQKYNICVMFVIFLNVDQMLEGFTVNKNTRITQYAT